MPNQCYLELHEIAGQSASLIAEDVLYLPYFLVEGWGIDLSTSFPPLTEHQLVMVDEIGLADLGHFDGNNQGDRDHSIEQDQIGAKHQKSISDCAIPSPKNIGMGIFIITYKSSIQTT